MNAWKKAAKGLRTNPRAVLAVLLLAALLAGVTMLNAMAERQTNARKGVEALQFEKEPDAWLAHPQTASHFRQALNTGSLAAVALANAHPGLVLYTLKSGERGSTRAFRAARPVAVRAPTLNTLATRAPMQASHWWPSMSTPAPPAGAGRRGSKTWAGPCC